MGAALTYARRYALFTLVGIAGEDDIDAPDLKCHEAAEFGARKPASTVRVPSNGGTALTLTSGGPFRYTSE